MKFYFCETCGKRLTEDQIAKGEARDKKLKGVFCNECAIGVTTMDTLPMNDAEARRTLAQESPGNKSGTTSRKRISGALPTRGSRKTSSKRIPAASRKDDQTESARVSPQSRTPLAIAAVAGVVPILIALLVWALSGPEKPEGTPSHSSRDTKANKKLPRETQSGIEVAEDEGETAKEKAQSVPTPQPEVKPESVRQPADQPSQEPEPSTKVKENTKPETKTDNDEVAAPKTSATTTGTSAETPPAKKDDGKKPEPSASANQQEEASNKALKTLISSVIAALRKNDIEQAQGLLEAGDKATQDHRNQLSAALKAIQDEEHAFRAALKRLVGKDMKLKTRKGIARGKIEKVEDDGLWVARRFVINGQERAGPSMKVKLADLTPDARKQIFNPAKPKDSAGWLGRALAAMASGDMDLGATALEAVGDHPLKRLLTEELVAGRNAQRDAVARSSWAELEKRAGMKLTSATAIRLKEEIAQWENEHGDSAYAKEASTVEKRGEIKKQVERLALGLDTRIAKLLHGHIESYDPRTLGINILWDLTNAKHRKDMIIRTETSHNNSSRAVVCPKGLRLGHASWATVLVQLPQFASGDLVVKIQYRDFKQGQPPTSYGLRLWFHDEESEGNAQRVSAEFRHDTMAFKEHTHQPKSFKTEPGLPVFPEKGTIEFRCKGKHYQMKLNGEVKVEYAAKEINDHRGFGLGGGWGYNYVLTHLQVKGRLDPRWLAKVLAPEK